MKAYLTSHNSPRVSITATAGNRWRTIDCQIDTGFSSGIALGSSLLSKLQPPKVAKQEFELADGSRVIFDVYALKIKQNEKVVELPAVFTDGGDNLVGMEFLRGHRLLLDLKLKPAKILLE